MEDEPRYIFEDVVPPRCGFCDAIDFLSRDENAYFDPTLVCHCGAIAFVAPPWDLDEAAENLVAHVSKGKASFAQPMEPVGDSGMLFAQPILPANELVTGLASELEKLGLQLRHNRYQLRILLEEPERHPTAAKFFPMDRDLHALWARPG